MISEVQENKSSQIKMDEQVSQAEPLSYYPEERHLIESNQHNFILQSQKIITQQHALLIKDNIIFNTSIQPLDFFQSSIYIDKSLFIRDIVKSISKCLLITRPQGWGKRMNFELLRYFLQQKFNQKGQKDQATETRIQGIFKRLKISNQNVMSIYRKYPVIYLNFQDIRGSSYQTIHTGILQQIIKCYYNHSYLLYSSSKCEQRYQQELAELLIPFKKIAFNKNTTSSQLHQSISLLVNMLHLYHSKKKVFVIINNYDFPINYLMQINQNNQLKDEIIKVNDLMSKIVVNSIKNNQYVSKIIINGIFDTLSKSTYPCLANFHVDNIINGQLYNHFGFTIEQINTSLAIILPNQRSAQQYTNKITQFYGTYQSKTKRLYKPQKIMKYMEQITKNHDNFSFHDAQHYQKRSIYSNLIYRLFDCKINAYFHSKLIKLQQCEERQLKYDPDISLIDFIKHPSNLEAYMVYTLVHTGVITKVMKQQGQLIKRSYFKIANRPILTNILKNTRRRVRIQDERQLYPIKRQQMLNDEQYTDDEQHQKSQSVSLKDKRITIELDNILGNCLTNMAIQINNGKHNNNKYIDNTKRLNGGQITIKITNFDNNNDCTLQTGKNDYRAKKKMAKINIF